MTFLSAASLAPDDLRYPANLEFVDRAKTQLISEHPKIGAMADDGDDLGAARGIIVGLAITSALYLVGGLTWWLI